VRTKEEVTSIYVASMTKLGWHIIHVANVKELIYNFLTLNFVLYVARQEGAIRLHDNWEEFSNCQLKDCNH
jgi:hypothetical protein